MIHGCDRRYRLSELAFVPAATKGPNDRGARGSLARCGWLGVQFLGHRARLGSTSTYHLHATVRRGLGRPHPLDFRPERAARPTLCRAVQRAWTATKPAGAALGSSIGAWHYSLDMDRSGPTIWTVGHSNHSASGFLSLLQSEQIEFVIDVRSFPYSKFAPHFNREDLERAIQAAGMRYIFLGEVLGGRPEVDEHFDDGGHALYGEMAKLPGFQDAIDRLVDGANEHRLAVMCSCGKPDDCHRRLLVGKVLTDQGVELAHILPSGEVQPETFVPIGPAGGQELLFGENEISWRSTQSVSRRRRLNTSSAA